MNYVVLTVKSLHKLSHMNLTYTHFCTIRKWWIANVSSNYSCFANFKTSRQHAQSINMSHRRVACLPSVVATSARNLQQTKLESRHSRLHYRTPTTLLQVLFFYNASTSIPNFTSTFSQKRNIFLLNLWPMTWPWWDHIPNMYIVSQLFESYLTGSDTQLIDCITCPQQQKRIYTVTAFSPQQPGLAYTREINNSGAYWSRHDGMAVTSAGPLTLTLPPSLQ